MIILLHYYLQVQFFKCAFKIVSTLKVHIKCNLLNALITVGKQS